MNNVLKLMLLTLSVGMIATLSAKQYECYMLKKDTSIDTTKFPRTIAANDDVAAINQCKGQGFASVVYYKGILGWKQVGGHGIGPKTPKTPPSK